MKHIEREVHSDSLTVDYVDDIGPFTAIGFYMFNKLWTFHRNYLELNLLNRPFLSKFLGEY